MPERPARPLWEINSIQREWTWACEGEYAMQAVNTVRGRREPGARAGDGGAMREEDRGSGG